MTKKVAIILANEFEDIEYSSPKEALENAGFNTVVIGDTANSEVVGKHGEKVTVDVGIAEAKPEDYDALLIPGGFSPDHLRGDTEGLDMAHLLNTLLKMMYQHLPFVMGHKY